MFFIYIYIYLLHIISGHEVLLLVTISFSLECFFHSGNVGGGYPTMDWPYEFPIYDSHFDAVPLMEYCYLSDPLYETLSIEPTPSLKQG